MVVGDRRSDPHFGRRAIGPSDADLGGIRIEDIRFKGAKGNTMSALLYIPPNATAQTPTPGILAVHGYINSRETQDGFAIEFARRGYVVLALDQIGHGYCDPPAFANGFGGPDGLAASAQSRLRRQEQYRP
jgi:cephalosporin-C deacetylase-like acetyl esterase